jgi:hypothetical protein
MNAFTARALKLVDDKEPDDWVVYAQSGPDWTETEVRGWWKERLFIKIPDSFCRGGDIAELDRGELRSKRYATHDGITYFTPDGKDREDAENAKTIAAGQMAEVMYIYYFSHDEKWVGRWFKRRVFNMNARWVFFYWGDGHWGEGGPENPLEYVDRAGFDSESGAWPFYSEAGMHAKQKRDEESAREQARQKAAAEAANRPCLLDEDANILGIGVYSTEAQVLTAFKRLARIHHPDAGGTAAAFQRISQAKDRAIPALKGNMKTGIRRWG